MVAAFLVSVSSHIPFQWDTAAAFKYLSYVNLCDPSICQHKFSASGRTLSSLTGSLKCVPVPHLCIDSGIGKELLGLVVHSRELQLLVCEAGTVLPSHRDDERIRLC